MIEIFKNLSKKELRLVFILLTIIFLYLVYMFILTPSIKKLKETENELSKLEKQKLQLNNDINLYNQLKNQYQNDSLEDLLLQLPDEGKVPEIILWIEELFQDPNVSNPNISFARGNNKEQYLELSISFTGPYINVKDLINKIEANKRLTIVENTNLNKGTSNLIVSHLVIKIYGQNFKDFSEKEYDFNNIDLFRRE
jgi:Tfp pilus assembly protein PilO